MNVALIEDPQHDIDRGDGRQDQDHLRVHGLLEHLRGPGERPAYAGRHANLGHRPVDGVTGFRQRLAGRQVKGDGRRRRKSLVIHRQRRVGRLPFSEIGKRNRLVFAVDHKHLIEGADVLGVDRVDLHHHFILIQRLVDGGDLPLAEGVVQQIVGVLYADAEPRHGIAIVDQVHLRAVILTVGVNVRQLRQRRQRFADFRLPFPQRRKVVRQQRILVAGVGLTAADADILYRHQEQVGPRLLRQLFAQPIDNLLGRFMALIARLEGDKHHPAVDPRAAGKTGDVVHRRIFTNDLHKVLQLAAHRLERDALVRLDAAHQHPGVLLGEEGFGNRDIEPDA